MMDLALNQYQDVLMLLQLIITVLPTPMMEAVLLVLMVVLIPQLITIIQLPILMMEVALMMLHQKTVMLPLGIPVFGISQEILLLLEEELGNIKIGVRPEITDQVIISGEFGAY
jgi:hypothetical protein